MMEWQIWIGAGVLDMDKGRAMDGEAGNMAYFSKWEVVSKMLWGGGGLVYPFLLELPLRFVTILFCVVYSSLCFAM